LKMLAERKAFDAFLRPLFRKHWVIYAKRPFGGPEHVHQRLERYWSAPAKARCSARG